MIDFYINSYNKKKLYCLGMCKNDIDRLERIVGWCVRSYGLCSKKLSYRIIVFKESWEVNVFSGESIEEDKLDKLRFKYECLTNNKSYPYFENKSLLGIMENRLGCVIDDFRNKELYSKIVKVRICDIKFRRFVEVDKSNDLVKNFGFGNVVENVEVGRFLYGFLKYKKWKNKSWLKIVDEYDEWRKKNNKDDLFNFFEY